MEAVLADAICLGKRDQAKNHQPENIPFVLIGAGMLWMNKCVNTKTQH